MAKSLPQAFLTQWLLQRACEIQVATGAAGTPVDIPPEVIAVHQRDLSGVQLPTGPGVPDFEALVRKIDRIDPRWRDRSEEHTSELQSLMRQPYSLFWWE